MPAPSPIAADVSPARPDERSGAERLNSLAGPGKRDQRLDSIRGFMLVAMTLNHLNTELRVFSDYSFGFVSTAEGFVFLSGLVASVVYTRYAASRSPAQMQQKARRRAAEIYFYHLGSFIAFFAGLHLLARFGHPGLYTSPPLFFQQPLTALALGASLLFQPGLFDILPMYCGFMLALPLMLSALQRGHWARLLGLSGGLWLVAQFGLRDHFERWLQTFCPVNLGVFDLLAWQLLFVAGVCFGFYWAKSPKPLLSFRPAMLAICLIVATPLWFLIKYQHPPAGLSMDLIWAWADKTHLAPLRLVDFIVLVYLIAAVAVRRPGFVTFRPLAFLGRHSLIVFTTQATVCAFVLTQPALAATFAARTATALAMVAILFPVAWLNEIATKRRVPQPPASAQPALNPPVPWVRVRSAAPVAKHRSPWNPPVTALPGKSALSSK
jgi:hypothetical protein